jgi:hypothetical protein
VLAAALGLGSYERLRPADADRSPAVQPETAADLFERGKRALRAGDVPSARADFLAAHKRDGDPRALAFAAYCFAVEGDSRVAASMGRQAITEGATAPEVYNLVGYALTQASEHAAAVDVLTEGLDRAPRMRAALYNRAVARYRTDLERHGRVVDTRCAADIAAVLAEPGPRSADLHYDAARIFATGSAVAPDLRDRAIEQLQAAAAAGRKPSTFRNDIVLRMNLARDPRFEDVCRGPFGPAEANRPQLRLVEPPY